MGARGPAPKPSALRILEGNPAKRPLNRAEPKPLPIAPKCPSWLHSEAKKEWKRVAPALERLGLLTQVDMAALAGYCQAYARWKEAEETLNDLGMTFCTDKGYIGPRPEVAIARTSLQLVKSFCSEFGLTPSARARMTLPESEAEDDDSPFDV